MYELLDQNSHLEPTVLDEFPNLKAFHARVQGLEQIAAYMKSDKFLARPLNGPMASFAGN
jgi:glutathione S-transferase